jgi:hypothetical protein
MKTKHEGEGEREDSFDADAGLGLGLGLSLEASSVAAGREKRLARRSIMSRSHSMIDSLIVNRNTAEGDSESESATVTGIRPELESSSATELVADVVCVRADTHSNADVGPVGVRVRVRVRRGAE